MMVQMQRGCRDIELVGSLSDNESTGRPRNFTREEVLERAMPVFWKHGFRTQAFRNWSGPQARISQGSIPSFETKTIFLLPVFGTILRARRREGFSPKEPLGWNNVETFSRMILSTGGNSRDVFLSTQCGSSPSFRMRLIAS
jgi:hypothetical protein